MIVYVPVCTCNDVTRSRGFGWRRRGFPPSGVPRGAPWELDARSPPGSQKTGLDARRGPASWERPADGGNASLRHACAHRAPGGSRHAPHDGLDALAAESEISLISAHFYGGGARGDASATVLWDQSRPRVSRGTKRPKQVQTAKRRNDAGFLDVYGRTTGVWTYRRTNAHDEGRARVAGLPTKLPITPSSSHHVETLPPLDNNERPAARLQV